MNKNKHSDLDDDLDHEGINRRQFMRSAGCATLGAGAAYYGGSQYAGSPVQNGQPRSLRILTEANSRKRPLKPVGRDPHRPRDRRD